MTDTQIRFDDGAAYERMMGTWSGLAGAVFVDWLEPSPGWRWIDVGCGNGAFSEVLVERCAPAEIEGIDPSQGQIDYARQRPAARLAKFGIGSAMALPFPADQVRRGHHGARDLLRAGTGQRRRRNGAGGAPRRHRRGLRMGHFGRRLSSGAAAGRIERDGNCTDQPAERRGVAARAPCAICGAARVSTRSKPARSRCNGPSPISRISGRRALLGSSVAPTIAAMSAARRRSAQSRSVRALIRRQCGAHHRQRTRQRREGPRAQIALLK